MHADSEAALGTIGEFSCPSASCNLSAAGISLLQEKCNVDLLPDHIRTMANVEIDALSRFSEGRKMPAALQGVSGNHGAFSRKHLPNLASLAVGIRSMGQRHQGSL